MEKRKFAEDGMRESGIGLSVSEEKELRTSTKKIEGIEGEKKLVRKILPLDGMGGDAIGEKDLMTSWVRRKAFGNERHDRRRELFVPETIDGCVSFFESLLGRDDVDGTLGNRIIYRN
jgi:hypothetical protein